MTRCLSILSLVLVAGLTTPAHAQATSPDAASVGRELVVPGAFPGIEGQLGITSLSDLALYEIDQAIDDLTGTFSARLRLHYTNTTGAPLPVLPLRIPANTSLEHGGAPMDVGSLGVSTAAAEVGPAVSLATVRPTLLELTFERPVMPGERVVINLEYDGQLRMLAGQPNDLFDQALSSLGSLTTVGEADYGLLAMGDGIVTMASAYPMVAPHREGSFDVEAPSPVGDLVYNQVAAFSVRTVLPAGLTLVSNLVDATPSSNPDGSTLTESAGTLVRDFVIVAARDLVFETEQVGDTRVRSVYREPDARAGHIALEVARDALNSFESRFGEYPYTELDVVEASLVGGAGGVEFSGLVLIAGMLYRDPLASSSELGMLLQMLESFSTMMDMGGGGGGMPAMPDLTTMMDAMLEFTVAHEVAHQWFAGLVGNDAHRFPSLDEPLAQYAAGLAYEDRHGAEAAREAMEMNVKMNYALYRMLGGLDAPVLRDTESYRSVIEYAALVYGKAPYLYVALRQSLGDARLHDAMRNAIAMHRFQIVSTEQWIASLEAAAGADAGVRQAFRRWLEETHADADLGIGDPSAFVINAMFPPEVAGMINETFALLGMNPGDLLRMLFGGELSVGPSYPPGLVPDRALDQLPPR